MKCLKFSTLLLLCVLFLGDAKAQIRLFGERASFNVNGNVTLVGNTLFTCAAGGDCAQVQAGTTPGLNGRAMIFVDVDPSAPGSFANSSTADLNLPAGSTVLYAGLYWGGRSGETTASRGTIYMKPPGVGATWNTVTATQIDTFVTDGAVGSRPYQAFANVTTQVAAAGNGTYSVGGMTAATGNDGTGFYGGWALAILYEDNNQTFKRLNLFDGAQRVSGITTVSVNVTGLVTPTTAGFETNVGALVWEGDNSLTGDSFVFEGNTLNRTLNPSNDFWNSSITDSNSHVTTKNPNYVNQLSMDLDLVDVTGLLPPNSTDADIDFVTNGDLYFPHFLTFSTELFVPDYSSTMTKTATDLNGGGVVRGDVIEYTISFQNTGEDDAINTVLTDSIPANMTYVPGSMEITSSSIVGEAGTLTDSSGNDNGEFDGSQVIIYLGDTATSSSGGTYQPTQGAVVKFQATVNNDAPLGTITNTATIVANSPTLPTTDFTSNASADITINDIVPPNDPVITSPTNGQITNDSTPLVIGTAEAGSTVVVTGPNGETCSVVADINGDWSCSISPALSEGSNTLSATAQDPDGNVSGSTNVSITVDTVAPAAPVINVPTNGAPVTGTGEPGATVTVTTGGSGTCTAVVQLDGTWSCTLSGPVVDGDDIMAT
ncbi:Ig-like domain-containing protein, partial [Marinicella litoralis]